MATGIPVVTSNVSSMPEAAGGAAILVDPYDVDAITDGIRTMLSDKRLCEALVQRGLSHARQATWERGGQQLLAAFEQTLA
jgi:glycosyltransferase involved in cell wall biosynthesis